MGQGACRRAWTALRTLRRWEIVALVAGVLTVVGALSPPLERLADERLSAHMVQHELLVLIAAPLLVLGRPLAVCLAALPPGLRAGVSRSARAADAGGLVAWLAHAVAIWVWHAPAPYDLAVRVPVLHALEHASLLGTAVLFWWALLHRPKAHAHLGAAAVYVFTTALHTGLLGVLLLLAHRPWYAHYVRTAASLGIDPLEDQQLAGLIMWIPGGVLLGAWALVCVAVWLREMEQRQAKIHATSSRLLAIAVVAATLLTACTGERSTAARLTGGDADRGREAVRRYGCWTCHTIPGVAGARAAVGPPLAGLASRSYVAGRPNSPEELVRWVRHPQDVRAPTPMPDMGVTEQDGRDIAAFLYTLR
jgi:cytochrome c oxidase assembly factor CtaG/cytochrome c2